MQNLMFESKIPQIYFPKPIMMAFRGLATYGNLLIFHGFI